MALLLCTLPGAAPNFVAELKRVAPDIEVRVWPEFGNPDDIEFAALHYFDCKNLQQFKNLKFVASLFAGLDHLVNDEGMPKGVPIVRAADPKGDQLMNETALMHVMRHHRHLHEYAINQTEREWKPRRPILRTHQRKVGVAGLGQIGLPMALYLKGFGFDVAGWTRTPRKTDGIEVFHGKDGFAPFLARSEILVGMLPVTPETENILDAKAFAQMPRGACIVNLARGNIVHDVDLIAALDSGQIAGATLDVFRVEPLPKEDPLWGHKRIAIMPHVARMPVPRDLVPQIMENVRRAQSGRPLEWVVDLKTGY
jgi:glyoxylate/hydroxypyruvate reductase A